MGVEVFQAVKKSVTRVLLEKVDAIMPDIEAAVGIVVALECETDDWSILILIPMVARILSQRPNAKGRYQI